VIDCPDPNNATRQVLAHQQAPVVKQLEPASTLVNLSLVVHAHGCIDETAPRWGDVDHGRSGVAAAQDTAHVTTVPGPGWLRRSLPGALPGDDRGHVLCGHPVKVQMQFLVRCPDHRAPRRCERYG
jgi:hypothetical protein